MSTRIWVTYWVFGAIPPIGLLASSLPARTAIAVVWLLGWIAGARWITRPIASTFRARALRRYDAALERQDGEAIRRIADDGESAMPRDLVAHLRGVALVVEERWPEARAHFEAMDLESVADDLVPYVIMNRALAAAHGGAPEDALTLTTPLVEGEPHPPAALLAAHGVALLSAGRANEALGPLQRSIDLGGPPWAVGRWHYDLGEALTALGRREEAERAYRRAAEQPSKIGRRARDRLAARDASRT